MTARSLGVDWHLPHQKRPFASTTQATSDLIRFLAGGGLTVAEARDVILFDEEGRAVLARLADEGYGHVALMLLVGGDTPQDEVAKLRRRPAPAEV